MSAKPDRVLLHDGHDKWRILKPRFNYGKPGPWASGEDRRVEEECVVHGDLADALRVLHRLEAADAAAVPRTDDKGAGPRQDNEEKPNGHG